MHSLKGHHEFESSNTLRNSVLPITIPKADRFKLEKKGSHFTEMKDMSQERAISTIKSLSQSQNMLQVGRNIVNSNVGSRTIVQEMK